MDGLKESALRWGLLGYFLETMFSYIGECVLFFFLWWIGKGWGGRCCFLQFAREFHHT